MRQPFLAGLALSAWALAMLGCDSSTSGSTEPSESGSLKVTITAPPGLTPSVVVGGPKGYSRSLTGSQSLTGLAPGIYTVSAGRAELPNAIAGTLYDATVTADTVSMNSRRVSVSVRVIVGIPVAATVTYAARPGTGALWVTTGGPHIRAYSAAALEAGGTPILGLDLSIEKSVPIAVAVDSSGSLWAVATNLNEGSPPLATLFTWSVAELGFGNNAHALLDARGDGAFLQGMAFDRAGNIWVTNKDANTILQFPSQLGAIEGFTPALTLSATNGSLNGPAGIAFDRNGNLWVANNAGSTIVEFGVDQLTNSGSPAPMVTLSAASSSLDGPFGLAFDTQGNLWVTNRNANTVVLFGATQLGASGSPTPLVTLSASGGSLSGPSGLALDASGDLWVANDVGGSLVEFGASQLRASGAPTPVVTLAGIGTSGPFGLAFSPPAGALYPNTYDPWAY